MILDHGERETLKGAVHAAVGGLAAVCALYNLAAHAKRPAPHLALNAVVYAALTAFEALHVAHHWQER